MLKTTLLKGFLGLGLLMIAQATTANVELACPNINTLQFSKESSDLFKVEGEVDVIKGEAPPFELHGTTTINKAELFIGAEYLRDRSQYILALKCLYAGSQSPTQHPIEFNIMNDPTFGLEYCYFPNSPGKECKGDYQYCALNCEFL